MESDLNQTNGGETPAESVYLFVLASQTFSAEHISHTLAQISSSKQCSLTKPTTLSTNNTHGVHKFKACVNGRLRWPSTATSW